MGVAHKTALGIALIALGSAATALAGGISDGVVKIGVLTDMSGQFSHESGEGAVTAVKMAVEDFGGTVLGKPIEVVSADHQNKPEIASAIACKWYDVEKVDMIANLINSSVALGVSQIAKDKERIAIINGSGSSRLTNDACTPNSVHYAYDTYSLARGTGAALMKSGGTSWYFLTADNLARSICFAFVCSHIVDAHHLMGDKLSEASRLSYQSDESVLSSLRDYLCSGASNGINLS